MKKYMCKKKLCLYKEKLKRKKDPQVFIYMGSYITKNNSTQITYERDPHTNYKSYKDLETKKNYNIKKEGCVAFETQNITLYPPISEYSEEEYEKKYKDLQNWFNAQLKDTPKSKIITIIQKKYSRKYPALYPSFQNIDTIMNVPIAEYLKTASKDGFIESFCISKEEEMRIKLYKKQLTKNQN